MKSNRTKKIKNYIITAVGLLLGFILFSQLSYRALVNNDNTIWRLILVEYPPILLGISFIEIEFINKFDMDKALGNLYMGVVIGTFFAEIIAYVFAIAFITDHTTLYSKIIYIAVLLAVGYIIYSFFEKRKWKLGIKILVLLMLILVPGGIIINESFAKYNVHKYNAIVENCKVVKTSKSTTYYIYFKGVNENIPLKKYTAKDIHEYKRLQQGSIVTINKYTGILGLPAIEVEN